MLLLPPNQQCQSTEGKYLVTYWIGTFVGCLCPFVYSNGFVTHEAFDFCFFNVIDITLNKCTSLVSETSNTEDIACAQAQTGFRFTLTGFPVRQTADYWGKMSWIFYAVVWYECQDTEDITCSLATASQNYAKRRQVV